MTAPRQRRGFTLVEILVVISCILLLTGLALPFFLGSREGAQDARAQSDVTNSLRSARAGSAASGAYASEQELLEQLRADNPGLMFVSCPGSQQPSEICPEIELDLKTVYVDLLTEADSGGQGEEVTLCALSQTQRIFCLRSNEPGNIQGILDDLRET